MTTHDLRATVREHDGIAVIDLTGDVNASAEHALDEAYAEAASNGGGALALNFAAADYINSTGIALIVGLLARARKTGIHVTAYGLSDHYREIFEITRLADFMTIADDEEGALRATEGTSDA